MAAESQIVFQRHWRREVADLADTLRAALAADERSDVRVIGGSRLPSAASLARGASAVVVSDTQDAPSARALRRLGEPLVFRLWWNGADEVVRHVEGGHGPDEVQVCFFADVAAEIVAAGIDVVLVPYAFSAPQPQVAKMTPTVGYTGEVDVSDGCFDGLTGRRPAATAFLGARARELAADVVAGRASLVETDVRVRDNAELEPDVARALLWAVRNHVRYALLKTVFDVAPDQVAIRGDDWAALGFPAAPTSFTRRLRMNNYRTHRVSLDLGSKSTNDALYPRAVDIMAMGGGLAQFHSGVPTPSGMRSMHGRRATSGPALVELVQTMLDAPEDALRAENAQIQREYAQTRLASGRVLLWEIAQRTR